MSQYKKPDVISNQVIMQFHRATGMGILEARKFLREASPVFYERIVEAALTQRNSEVRSYSTLHDPIQDDPQFTDAIRNAAQKAQDEVVARYGSEHRMGLCYVFWRLTKKNLLEDHGIEWFTPAEMNPGVIFD